MRSVVAICLLALVLSASAKPTVQKADTHTILAEMETSKFGAAFLNFLSLQASSDVDITTVQTTVGDFIDSIQEHQADDDSRNDQNQATCDELISALTTQVNNERVSVDSLQNAITTNTEIFEQAKLDLELTASDLDETVASLEAGEAQREGEHSRWVDVDYEHENAINQLEESIKLIKHLIHGVTFAQIKPRFEKVQESLRKSSKFSSLFKPLILSLSELATKLNYEHVVEIIDLLNNILKAVEQSRADYARTEDTQAGDWAELEAHLSDQKASLSDKKSRLNALITSTSEIIDSSRNSLEFHNNQLVRLEEALAEQEHWCETVFGIYTDNTNERARQSDVLTRVSDHIDERYGSVVEYLQTRKISF